MLQIPGIALDGLGGGVATAGGATIGILTFFLPFVLGLAIPVMLLNGWYNEGIRISLALFKKKPLLTLYDGSGNEQTWAANKTTPDSIYFVHPKTKRNFKIDRSRYDKHGYTIISNKARRYHYFSWALPSDIEQLQRINQIVQDIRSQPERFPFLSKFKHDDEITESLTTLPDKLEKTSKRWAKRYRTLTLEKIVYSPILNDKGVHIVDGTGQPAYDKHPVAITDLENEFIQEINEAWNVLQTDFLRPGPVDIVGGFNAMVNPIAPETLNDMETIASSNKSGLSALAGVFSGNSFGPMIVGAVVGILLVKMAGV